MLSFLSPLFLAGVAAAAVPIVLHLLKREPEARPLPLGELRRRAQRQNTKKLR